MLVRTDNAVDQFLFTKILEREESIRFGEW